MSRKSHKNIVFSEIILICWDRNSETKIHNHPNGGCILKVLKGNLNEKLYCNNTKQIKQNNVLKENDTSYIDDNIGLHSIHNNNNISFTLHIYSPPNFYED